MIFGILFLYPLILGVVYLEACDIVKTRHIFISVISQLDAQNFCFKISLFHASTCFEHM